MTSPAKKILLGLALGLVVYLAMAALWADLDGVGAEMGRFAWPIFLAAIALAMGNYAVRFVKWEIYLRILEIRLPPRESALVFLSSFLLTVTPGKIGEVMKSVLLKRSREIPVSVTAPIVVAERLTDLLSLLCLALVGISTYAYGTGALIATAIIVLGLVGLLSIPRVVVALIALMAKVPLVGRLAPRIVIAYGSMREMVRPGPLLVTTAIGVVGWGLECVAFYLVIGGFPGGEATLLGATFVYALTTILGAVSFLPGGLGVTEASMAVLLVELGMLAGESPAVAATCVIRLATLWFAVLVGLVAFSIYRTSLAARGRSTDKTGIA